MKADSRGNKVASCLLLMLVVTLYREAFASASNPSGPAEGLPSVIAKAVETVPFSFVYGGRPSRELLRGWALKQVTQTLTGNRERRWLTYRDPRTGLEITDEITLYKGLAAVDWIVRLRNTGPADTPIIEDLRALDLRFDAPGTGDIRLHQVNGSSHNRLEEDYLPIEEDVGHGASSA